MPTAAIVATSFATLCGTSDPGQPRTPKSSSACSATGPALTSPLPLSGLTGLPPFGADRSNVSGRSKVSGTYWRLESPTARGLPAEDRSGPTGDRCRLPDTSWRWPGLESPDPMPGG